MSAIEIVLIIIGAVMFLLGYLLPARKKDVDEEVQLISEDEVRKTIAKEVEGVKEQIEDIVEETINYSMERAERSMEKVSNEKIMAINEYSDTVLEEINKNHKEVVFLYDMLNDKHDNLMTTITQVTQAADEIKQTVRDAEITADETARKVDEAQETVNESILKLRLAEQSAREAERVHNAEAYHTEVLREVRKVFDDHDSDAETDYGEEDIVSDYPDEYVEPERRVVRYEEAEPERRAVRYEEADAERRAVRYEEADAERRAVRYEEADAERRVVRYEEAEPERRAVRYEEAEPERRTVRYEEPDAEHKIRYEDAGTDHEDVRPESGLAEEESLYTVAEFTPISPKRVEIIHKPDGDYVADQPEQTVEDISTSAAFAEMGIFGNVREEDEFRKRGRGRRSTRKDQRAEDTAGVDIRFVQGNDNGRNSNDRILELHKAGKSNMAIAKELGLGIGEVKLVIDLFEGM